MFISTGFLVNIGIGKMLVTEWLEREGLFSLQVLKVVFQIVQFHLSSKPY